MPNYAQAPKLINKKPKAKGNFIQVETETFSNVVKMLGRKYKAAILFMWLAGQKDGFKIPLKTVCDALGFTKTGYYDARKDLSDAGILTVDEEVIKINYDVIAGKLSKNPKGTDFPDTTALSESSMGTDFPDTSTKNRVLKTRTQKLKGTENPDSIFTHCPENPDNEKNRVLKTGTQLVRKTRTIVSGKPGQPCPENQEYNIENIELHIKNIEENSSVEEFLKTNFIHKDDNSVTATGKELLEACEQRPEKLAQVYEYYPETQKYKEYFGEVDWSGYEF